MSPRRLIRMSGLACILGGICIIVFVLIHPWDRLVGAANALDPRWQLAHTLHFVGAIFAVLGLPGLYAHQREQLGTPGLIGFALSLLGTAMFLGTGMITAFIWPMLALCAPDTVELDGGLFGGLGALTFLMTSATMMVGYVLFGAVMLRIGAMPRLGIVMLVAGAIFGMLPPHPLTALPWAGMVLGGVFYGVGLAWLGAVLWKENAPAANAPRDGRTAPHAA
jgi:hypothetical protein